MHSYTHQHQGRLHTLGGAGELTGFRFPRQPALPPEPHAALDLFIITSPRRHEEDHA